MTDHRASLIGVKCFGMFSRKGGLSLHKIWLVEIFLVVLVVSKSYLQPIFIQIFISNNL